MFRLVPPFSRNADATSRASSPTSSWRGGELKSNPSDSLGHGDTYASSPWIPQPVRHPFQHASNFRAVSIASDSPLHPTSHLDLLATPTAPSTQLGQSSVHPGSERRPPTRLAASLHESERLLRMAFIKNKKALTLLITPLPVVLSIVYLVIGHAILERAAHSSSSSPYITTPLVSSVKVGAVGGAILTIPLIAVFHLLLFLSTGPAPGSSDLDDFFDDESALNPRDIWLSWRGILGYLVSAMFMVFMGAFAGPLGSVCLASGKASGVMLAPPQATEAGAVGGLVSCPAIAGMSLAFLLVLRRVW